MSLYVRNKHGTPLMSYKPGSAGLLLKAGKAKVVNKELFQYSKLRNRWIVAGKK